MTRRGAAAKAIVALACLAAGPTSRPAVELDHGGIVRGDVSSKTLALVFTGGDYADGVPTILRVCAARGVPASFFVTGAFLRQHADAARAIVAAGHLLGPHSDAHLLYCDWDDRAKTLVTKAAFKADVAKNLADVRAVGGGSTYFLPPFEWFNEDQVRWSRELGLTLVNFTPGSGSNRDYVPEGDAKFAPSKAIADDLLKFESTAPHGLNGFILLLHAGSLRADKMTDQLDALVAEIQCRGYRFVTLDELLQRP